METLIAYTETKKKVFSKYFKEIMTYWISAAGKKN